MTSISSKFLLMIITLILSFTHANSQSADLVIKAEKEKDYFEKANELIFPYIKLADRDENSQLSKDKQLKEGIRYLDAVTEINPKNFAAFWLKGKAYQALNDSENAYLQFKESFKINKENPDVARELMIECLNLNKFNEGVEVALHASSLDKENAGLLGNLALAYLLNGNLDEANATIKKALQIDPNDSINLNLRVIIEEVKTGKRKKPMKISDLY